MKHYTHIIRYSIFGCLLCGALLCSAALSSVSAQDKGSAITPSRERERDPFIPYKPTVRPKVNKVVATPIPIPSIQERISRYKAQKMAAMNAQLPAPKPTTALILSEMQVIGIFRTPRGFAAMVEATPIHLSYVVYPGEMFYNGQLVAIEENRLVFRNETRWTDGRRETSVEIKPLRQPDAVTESLAATRSTSDAEAAPEAVPAKEEKEKKAAATEKQ